MAQPANTVTRVPMPLKVCLHIYAFGAGGAERQIVNLARELSGRGVQVVLLHAQK